MRRVTGNAVANSIPTFRSLLNADDTKPTTLGPAEQPKSPPSASSANIAVEPVGSLDAEIENVPGHIIPTLNPHNAQPASDIAGTGDNATTIYDAIHTADAIGIIFRCGTLSPYFPYNALAVPINTANINVPVRSPTVLEIPSPLHAKVETH